MILILASILLISGGPSATEPEGDYIALSGYTQKEDGNYSFGIIGRVSGERIRETYEFGDTVLGMKIVDFEKVLVPRYNEKTKVTEYHDRSVLTLLDPSSKDKLKLTMFEFHLLKSSNKRVHATASTLRVPAAHDA
jgi:hypothetical protein